MNSFLVAEEKDKAPKFHRYHVLKKPRHLVVTADLDEIAQPVAPDATTHLKPQVQLIIQQRGATMSRDEFEELNIRKPCCPTKKK